MSKGHSDSNYEQIRDVIARLQSAVQDLSTLLGLLTSPLDALKILPPRFVEYNLSPLPAHAVSVTKHVPLLQRALLEHVLPAWGPTLDDEKYYELIQQYFSPDIFLMSSPAAKDVAVHAYDTLLSLPLTEHSIRLLVILTKTYPVDVLWSATAARKTRGFKEKTSITWEDCVRNVSAIPGKVANALGGRPTEIPAELEPGTYFNTLSTRTEVLISSLSSRPTQGQFSSSYEAL